MGTICVAGRGMLFLLVSVATARQLMTDCSSSTWTIDVFLRDGFTKETSALYVLVDQTWRS
jgi:hypothetical protein